MKPDQHRVKTLLADTVIMLCKSGISFERTLTIQGLLGVTVDGGDVFVVHINRQLSDSGEAERPSSLSICGSSEKTIEAASRDSQQSLCRHEELVAICSNTASVSSICAADGNNCATGNLSDAEDNSLKSVCNSSICSQHETVKQTQCPYDVPCQPESSVQDCFPFHQPQLQAQLHQVVSIQQEPISQQNRSPSTGTDVSDTHHTGKQRNYQSDPCDSVVDLHIEHPTSEQSADCVIFEREILKSQKQESKHNRERKITGKERIERDGHSWEPADYLISTPSLSVATSFPSGASSNHLSVSEDSPLLDVNMPDIVESALLEDGMSEIVECSILNEIMPQISVDESSDAVGDYEDIFSAESLEIVEFEGEEPQQLPFSITGLCNNDFSDNVVFQQADDIETNQDLDEEFLIRSNPLCSLDDMQFNTVDRSALGLSDELSFLASINNIKEGTGLEDSSNKNVGHFSLCKAISGFPRVVFKKRKNEKNVLSKSKVANINCNLSTAKRGRKRKNDKLENLSETRNVKVDNAAAKLKRRGRKPIDKLVISISKKKVQTKNNNNNVIGEKSYNAVSVKSKIKRSGKREKNDKGSVTITGKKRLKLDKVSDVKISKKSSKQKDLVADIHQNNVDSICASVDSKKAVTAATEDSVCVKEYKMKRKRISKYSLVSNETSELTNSKNAITTDSLESCSSIKASDTDQVTNHHVSNPDSSLVTSDGLSSQSDDHLCSNVSDEASVYDELRNSLLDVVSPSGELLVENSKLEYSIGGNSMRLRKAYVSLEKCNVSHIKLCSIEGSESANVSHIKLCSTEGSQSANVDAKCTSLQ